MNCSIGCTSIIAKERSYLTSKWDGFSSTTTNNKDAKKQIT